MKSNHSIEKNAYTRNADNIFSAVAKLQSLLCPAEFFKLAFFQCYHFGLMLITFTEVITRTIGSSKQVEYRGKSLLQSIKKNAFRVRINSSWLQRRDASLNRNIRFVSGGIQLEPKGLWLKIPLQRIALTHTILNYDNGNHEKYHFISKYAQLCCRPIIIIGNNHINCSTHEGSTCSNQIQWLIIKLKLIRAAVWKKICCAIEFRLMFAKQHG